MSPGKQFEIDFRDSINKLGYFQFRPKDCPAAWHQNKDARSDNVTFTARNEYDLLFYIWGNLYTLEFKSFAGTSFPFASIRDSQVKGLLKSAQHSGVISGVVLNFRKYSRTFFIPINLFINEQKTSSRKSINLDRAIDIGIEIEQTKKIVHYAYNVASFVSETAFFDLEDMT